MSQEDVNDGEITEVVPKAELKESLPGCGAPMRMWNCVERLACMHQSIGALLTEVMVSVVGTQVWRAR